MRGWNSRLLGRQWRENDFWNLRKKTNLNRCIVACTAGRNSTRHCCRHFQSVFRCCMWSVDTAVAWNLQVMQKSYAFDSLNFIQTCYWKFDSSIKIIPQKQPWARWLNYVYSRCLWVQVYVNVLEHNKFG